MRFSLTGGQRADVSQAIPLLTGIETGAVIADKGYESNRLLAFIRDQGAEAVIPPKSNRRDPWEYDRELYRERNLIERAFNKLKQCVKGGEKTCHWGGIKLYHLGGA